MRNLNSRQETLLDDQQRNSFISSISEDEVLILETQKREKKGFCYKLTSCDFLCFKKKSDEVVPWVEQTQNQLQLAFRKYQWKKTIQFEIQKFIPEALSRVQQELINKLRIVLNYNEPISQSQIQKSFNIQYEPINVASQTQQYYPKFETTSQSLDRIQVPSRTYSILDDGIQNLRNSKQAINSMNQELYKNAMKIIEEQVEQKTHPINILFVVYIKNFLEQNPPLREIPSIYLGSKILEPLAQKSIFRGTFMDSKYKLEQRVQKIIDELRSFVGFIALATYTFYQIDCQFTKQLQYFNVHNLSSFALSILFKENQLYDLIFNCFETILKDEINQFAQNLQSFELEKPAFFGVPTHLELTEESVDLIKKGNNQEQKVQMVEYSTELNLYESRIFEVEKKLMKQSSEPTMPYYLAIKQLRTLKNLRSPLHQLKALSKTTDFIQESINEFYYRHGLDLVKNFGADEMVPILCYIITQSKINNLGCYLKLIENFTPSEALNSAAGYKLITLQGCYNQILLMKPQSLIIQKKSNNTNIDIKDQVDSIFVISQIVD